MGEDIHNNIGSAAVKRATGKEWAEWFTILDAWGATKHSHTEIADYLYKEQKVPAWWCQMVTVGYEQARGLRAKHQKSDGFSVGVSRVMPYAAERVFEAWEDGERRKWLPEDLTITTRTKPKSLRAKLLDGSRLSLALYPKRADKVQLTIQQEKLTSEKEVEKQRAFWKQSLDRLQAHLG